MFTFRIILDKLREYILQIHHFVLLISRLLIIEWKLKRIEEKRFQFRMYCYCSLKCRRSTVSWQDCTHSSKTSFLWKERLRESLMKSGEQVCWTKKKKIPASIRVPHLLCSRKNKAKVIRECAVQSQMRFWKNYLFSSEIFFLIFFRDLWFLWVFFYNKLLTWWVYCILVYWFVCQKRDKSLIVRILASKCLRTFCCSPEQAGANCE